MTSGSLRSPFIPFLVASLGIAFFAVMDGVMKHLAIALGAYNAVLWRCFAGALIGAALMLIRRRTWPTAPVMRLHLLRSVVVAGMAVSFFWALARLPMAEAIALSFFAPLITLYLAALLLGEQVGRRAVIASLLGLAGVAVILSAKIGADASAPTDWMAIGAVFASAVLYAYNLILARQQAQQAWPVDIAFFQSLLVGMILSLFAPWWAVIPATDLLPDVGLAAALATISLLLLGWAYARAEAQILVMVEYTAFVWAALIGWWWFDEGVAWQTVAGVVLIVIGCVIVARGKPDAVAHIETTVA